ncbi:MAG: prepilin-type N-terminal cleavage/methylation domain-containing protein [Planctomycetota bacterium]
MKQQRHGFTLLEMLLALTLTSLLTGAIGLMIGQAARERGSMREASESPAWAMRLIEIVERDLRQAQWWAGAEDRVVLIGLGRDGLPAKIEYRWMDEGTGSALTRQERPLVDGRDNTQTSIPEVVGFELSAFRVGGFVLGEAATLDQASGPAAPTAQVSPTLLIEGRAVPLQPLPDRVGIRLGLEEDLGPGPGKEVVLR